MTNYMWVMVPSEGLEPPTPGLGNRCSIQLSYEGVEFGRRPGYRTLPRTPIWS